MTNDNFSQYPPPRRPGGRFFDSIRGTGITRTIDGRWIGGVAGAVAERTGIDRTLVRGLAIVLCLFFGIGVLLYGLAWLFLPEPDGRIHAEGVLHGVWSGGFIGSCLVVLLGLGNPGIHAPWLFWPAGHDFWGWFGPVLGIGIVVAVIVYAVKHHDDHRPQGPGAGDAGRRHYGGGPGQAGGGPGQGGDEPRQPGSEPRQPGGEPAADPAGDDETVVDARPTDEPTAAFPASGDEPTATFPASGYGDAAPRPAYQPAVSTVRYRTDTRGVGVAPPVPRPPRMITKPAGGPLTLLFAGLAIVAVAAGWLVEREIGLPGNGRLVAVGLGLAVVGIGIVLAGAWGRRGGGLTGWAWVGLIIALIVAIVPAAGRLAAVQNSTWTPASVRVAEHGYSVGVGSTTVDLSNLTVPSSGVTTVPVNSGIGDVKVVLPPDETAKVKMAGAGEWHRGNADRGFGSSSNDSDGFDRADVRTRTTKYGNGPAHLIVKIRMGIGNVTVDKAKEGTHS